MGHYYIECRGAGRWLVHAWCWLLVLMLLPVGAACTGTETNPPPTPFPGIGQVFHATKDGWDITVTSVSSESISAEATGLRVEIHATNTGSSAHALGPNRFKLHDAMGRTWKEMTYEAAGGLIQLALQDVQPGLSTDLGLDFLVPRSAQGLWLETIGGGHIVLEAVGTRTAGSATATVVPVDEPAGGEHVNQNRQFVAQLGHTPSWSVTTDDGFGHRLVAVGATCAPADCFIVHFFIGTRYLGTDTYRPSTAPISSGATEPGRIELIYEDSETGRAVPIHYTWDGDKLTVSGTPPAHEQ